MFVLHSDALRKLWVKTAIKAKHSHQDVELGPFEILVSSLDRKYLLSFPYKMEF